MSNNLTLEQFVNSIRNLYASAGSSSTSGSVGGGSTSSSGSNQAQQQQQQSSDQHSHQSSSSRLSLANYGEILNVINSNLEALTDNAANLIDNVLPVFSLPEFSLPNMAVLYAVICQLQQQPTLTINQEKLLNEIENCIRNADERQVFYDLKK